MPAGPFPARSQRCSRNLRLRLLPAGLAGGCGTDRPVLPAMSSTGRSRQPNDCSAIQGAGLIAPAANGTNAEVRATAQIPRRVVRGFSCASRLSPNETTSPCGGDDEHYDGGQRETQRPVLDDWHHQRVAGMVEAGFRSDDYREGEPLSWSSVRPGRSHRRPVRRSPRLARRGRVLRWGRRSGSTGRDGGSTPDCCPAWPGSTGGSPFAVR